MRRINVVGYYGWDNFGDELFRAAVHKNRHMIWGENTSLRSFVTPFRFLHQNVGIAGSVTRTLEALVGAIWADTIAICGGSVLEEVRGTQRLRAALIHRRRKIEALGVSLGPWRADDAKEGVREYISRMERVVVRDKASQQRIGEDIVVGGDLAALYPMPVHPLSERPYLTICPSKDSGASADEVIGLLATLLPDVNLPIKVLALNVRPKHGDIEFSKQIAAELRRSGHDTDFAQFDTLDQTIDVIARSRAVWSQRLHGVIVSYLCGVPLLALSHHQKISDFASDIGLPSRFAPTSLSPSDAMLGAAEETLRGAPFWALDPEDYRAHTRAALAHWSH